MITIPTKPFDSNFFENKMIIVKKNLIYKDYSTNFESKIKNRKFKFKVKDKDDKIKYGSILKIKKYKVTEIKNFFNNKNSFDNKTHN